MLTVKITTVGNSLGIILPREILQRMGVEKGDVLHLVETQLGVELSAFDPEFAQQLGILETVLHAERQVLPRLNRAGLAADGGTLPSSSSASSISPTTSLPPAALAPAPMKGDPA